MTIHEYELQALRRYYHKESFVLCILTFAVTVFIFCMVIAWLH